MGKQVTEMLKGTLEGIVLAILSGRPAYGYEITAWLREKGFSDIAEGTVKAMLFRARQSLAAVLGDDDQNARDGSHASQEVKRAGG